MINSKRLIASACALLVTASSATAVFAADDFKDNTSQQQDRPAQEMMQDQKPNQSQGQEKAGKAPEKPGKDQTAKPEMNGEKPADLPEMNGEKPADLPEMNGEKPADLPEMNGEKPADLPEMNGEKPADLPEMNEGRTPPRAKEADEVLNEISKSGDAADDSITGLVDDYSNAVDAERNATDEDSKLTAAKLVKELVDKINALLEKLNLSIRINAPADKPEVPSTGTAQGSNA